MILPDQIHSKQSKDLIKKSPNGVSRRQTPLEGKENSSNRLRRRAQKTKQNKFTWVSAKRKAVDGVWKSAPFPRHLSKKYKSERIILKIKNTLWLLYKCEKCPPLKLIWQVFFLWLCQKKSPPRIYVFFLHLLSFFNAFFL